MTADAFRTRLADEIARVRRLAADAPFVANGDLAAYAEPGGPLPAIILVADNPGAKERLHGEYLSGHGRAGGMARAFFDTALGPDSFRTHVLALNKSSYHTPRTEGLTLTMRHAAPALLAALSDDQAANGRFAADAARQLGIPVVAIGTESDGTTFRPFRTAFDTACGPTGFAALFETATLARPIRKVPHFSLSKIFCRNSDPAWNALISAFLARWTATYPALATANGNVSSRVLLGSGDAALHRDFLRSVILGI